MSYAIEYRSAQGAAASAACDNALQYQAIVARLLEQHVARGEILEKEHGQVVVRDRDGVRLATYWFVE